MSFKIHYRNNLIGKKDSYLISHPPSWDDHNYSYGHQFYPSEFCFVFVWSIILLKNYWEFCFVTIFLNRWLIWQIWEEYTFFYFSSNFDEVFFSELIVTNASGSILLLLLVFMLTLIAVKLLLEETSVDLSLSYHGAVCVTFLRTGKSRFV